MRLIRPGFPARRPRAAVLKAVLLGGCAMIGTAAHAAETAPGSAVLADASATSLEEVVVTARRREENAQTVPVALNAFSAETLEARRAYNVRDLQQLAPSLVVTVTNPR